MKSNKKRTIIAVVLVLILAVGITAFAVSNYGSKDDPLIAKSYLDSVVLPDLQTEMRAELEKAIDELESGGTPTGEFKVITLSNGQNVKCEVGCEVMLRIGSAKAEGADYPVLVDTTTAQAVSSGSAMTVNHLYMVTIKGNGFTATADNTKLLICGSYTVG